MPSRKASRNPQNGGNRGRKNPTPTKSVKSPPGPPKKD